MVATTKPREIDMERPSQTEQLANWISRVRCKKLMCRRNRKRDLRVEAVLTCALYKAEHELRNKQLSRINRWQQLKRQFLKDASCPYGFYNGEQNDDGTGNPYEEKHNPWQGDLCPELSSFDNFMSKLGEIKMPLQRWTTDKWKWRCLGLNSLEPSKLVSINGAIESTIKQQVVPDKRHGNFVIACPWVFCWYCNNE